MSGWELTNIAARLVLPPGALIVLALLGLAFMRAAPRFGRGVALLAVLSLYALATPFVAGALIRTLEVPYSDPADDRSGGAIVVLGGGSYLRAPEYGRDTVSRENLERLRYGVYLQRRIGRPLLVTGGNPTGADTSEAEQMQAVLREFGTSAKWLEDGARNTFENARLTRRMLESAGVDRVYLVTHAWHMPRAVMAFERHGMQVIPAPTAYKTRKAMRALDFFPSAGALADTWFFFHEIAGIAWYRLKFALAH